MISPTRYRSSSLPVNASYKIIIRYLTVAAQYVFLAKFSRFKIAGAADCNGTGVTEYFPLPLRRLDCQRRTCTVNDLTVGKAAVDQVECHCLEPGDFGHGFHGPQVVNPLKRGYALSPTLRCNARMTTRERLPASSRSGLAPGVIGATITVACR
jgi:hypothetical protein